MTLSKTQLSSSPAYDLMLFILVHNKRGERQVYLLQILRPIIDVFEDPRQFIPKAKMKALAWGQGMPSTSE